MDGQRGWLSRLFKCAVHPPMIHRPSPLVTAHLPPSPFVCFVRAMSKVEAEVVATHDAMCKAAECLNLRDAKKKVDAEQPASTPGLFLADRLKMYESLKAKQDAALAAKPRLPIKISLADARQFDGVAWQSTPMDVAHFIGKSVAEAAVVAKVNGVLWDLMRPLEGDCSIEILDFESKEGQEVFWHSSAHLLGEASEHHFGCHLCFGPPTEEGFFYDMKMEDRVVVNADYKPLESFAAKFAKEKQPFERLEMSKNDLMEMFKYNPLKCRLIDDKIPDGSMSTVYRCGSLIDPCLGPHVPDTGRIKEFKILKHSSSYFMGNAENESLQRIYGISFPNKHLMKEYEKFVAEAEKRDHRKIGKDQSLFFFHDLSPGSCFWFPHGTRIYNALVDMMRAEYRKRGFTEVITPNVYNVNLWKTSGHWENYRENMYSFEVEKDQFALKPMNCPGHCLMFAQKDRSYRELPIRFADFGVLHRNEISGALTGLSRVRRFQQDDAHIFCTFEQISVEIEGCLDFLKHIYQIFGFEFSMRLSTRPEKFMGDISLWNAAEAQLEAALNKSGLPWDVNPGDGAFYGPKIDITITDAHRRRHQCGTIQLDFQLPIRFDLKYRTGTDPASVEAAAHQAPVIIHRAILGSVERMAAMLIEHFGGDWPFWLSPRQICVIPISHANDAYAQKVNECLFDAGLHADVDISDLTFNKKIRNAEVSHYNYIIVVGKDEEEKGCVNIRNAVDKAAKNQLVSLDVAVEMFLKLKNSKSRQPNLE